MSSSGSSFGSGVVSESVCWLMYCGNKFDFIVVVDGGGEWVGGLCCWVDVVFWFVYVYVVVGVEEDLCYGFRGGLRVEVGSFILGF